MSDSHFPQSGFQRMIDVRRNRQAHKWTRKQLVGRLLWDMLSVPLFAWSPRQIWIWRRIVLRMFGARVGKAAHIFPTVQIAVPWNVSIGADSAVGDHAKLYSLGRIEIGSQATISQGAHLCAGSHDYRFADMPLMKPPIVVGNGVWVCADAFIGPGVAIGHGAIVGARAVVTKDIPENKIVVGNPAQVIGDRPEISSYTDL
jgi:putative colanic acid biosynthesis acetyltransferase WcaF